MLQTLALGIKINSSENHKRSFDANWFYLVSSLPSQDGSKKTYTACSAAQRSLARRP